MTGELRKLATSNGLAAAQHVLSPVRDRLDLFMHVALANRLKDASDYRKRAVNSSIADAERAFATLGAVWSHIGEAASPIANAGGCNVEPACVLRDDGGASCSSSCEQCDVTQVGFTIRQFARLRVAFAAVEARERGARQGRLYSWLVRLRTDLRGVMGVHDAHWGGDHYPRLPNWPRWREFEEHLSNHILFGAWWNNYKGELPPGSAAAWVPQDHFAIVSRARAEAFFSAVASMARCQHRKANEAVCGPSGSNRRWWPSAECVLKTHLKACIGLPYVLAIERPGANQQNRSARVWREALKRQPHWLSLERTRDLRDGLRLGRSEWRRRFQGEEPMMNGNAAVEDDRASVLRRLVELAAAFAARHSKEVRCRRGTGKARLQCM